MTDEELLLLLRSDPRRGLETVIRQYTAYVMKIAYLRLGSVCSREDMEEAVSDIFMKFYSAGQKNGFDFSSVRGCLSIIAGRHCVDIFRKVTGRPEMVSLDEIIEYTEDTSQGGEDSYSGIAEAVDALGEPDRTIFLRKYFFGQKTADIAKDLDMKPNTVDKRVTRGLVRLRKMLEEGEICRCKKG